MTSESRRALLLAAAASPLAAACGGGSSMGMSSPDSAAGAGGGSSAAGLPLLAEGQPLRPLPLLANETGAAGAFEATLRAAPAQFEYLIGRPTDALAYNGTSPGPAIVATEGERVRIRGSIVRDAIIEEGCQIEDAAFEHSLVGRNVRIKGSLRQLNVGDDDVIS